MLLGVLAVVRGVKTADLIQHGDDFNCGNSPDAAGNKSWFGRRGLAFSASNASV
jgi:hypothetical protein